MNGGTETQTALPQVPAITGAQTTGMPQIYQYTDPVTGQISYIDSNGQEYLDPNNPQHQNQLMQMSNPQLIAQQTNKQNILSYNQPTGQAFTQQQQPQQQQQQQPQYTNTVYLQQQQQQQPQQPQQQPQFIDLAKHNKQDICLDSTHSSKMVIGDSRSKCLNLFS